MGRVLKMDLARVGGPPHDVGDRCWRSRGSGDRPLPIALRVVVRVMDHQQRFAGRDCKLHGFARCVQCASWRRLAPWLSGGMWVSPRSPR